MKRLAMLAASGLMAVLPSIASARPHFCWGFHFGLPLFAPALFAGPAYFAPTVTVSPPVATVAPPSVYVSPPAVYVAPPIAYVPTPAFTYYYPYNYARSHYYYRYSYVRPAVMFARPWDITAACRITTDDKGRNEVQVASASGLSHLRWELVACAQSDFFPTPSLSRTMYSGRCFTSSYIRPMYSPRMPTEMS